MKTIRCTQCNLVNLYTNLSCNRCDYPFPEIDSETTQYVSSENSFVAEETESSFYPNQSERSYQSSDRGLNQQFQAPYQPNYQFNHRNKLLKKKLAVYSMIFGILSFPIANFAVGTVLCIIGALLFGSIGVALGFIIAFSFIPTGLITGIVALVKANKSPYEYGGKGFAIAGIVLSGFSFLVVPIVIAIAIPNLLAARRAANEGSAISSLRDIAKAQTQFGETKYHCGDLNELGQNKLIDSVLAKGTKSGYIFFITRTPNGCDIYAKPSVENGISATGTRSFYFSLEEGKLRTSSDKGVMPTNESPILSVEGFPNGYSFRTPQIANR